MRANKHLLLWSSLGTLALLGWAAYEEDVQEWRTLQREYRDLLPEESRDAFSLQLRQVVVPELKIADRCVSCHIGMAVGEQPVAGHRLFAAHPDVVHAPASYGCTPCHGGQGRATARADAHGEVLHWPEPMIPAKFAYAGCGACHTHLAVPNLARLDEGHALFERSDCLRCHAVDGRGGTLRPGESGEHVGPDLSTVGMTGMRADWYAEHLARLATAGDGPWTESFGPLPPNQRAAIGVYLDSRVGAPGLVESKALFHSLGCRGCHPIDGVGGDDGPDLTRAGQKDPGQLDFSHVPGPRRVSGWLAEHFRAPSTVVPDSAMPDLGLTEQQIDSLIFYTLSLRRSGYPEAYWPRDRIRSERFGAREFATDGATLYGTFCAACHGPQGEGMRYPGMVAFPAVGHPDFVGNVSDDFLRQTIVRGRPGRRMPAWGELEGGLEPAEIDAVVAHLRRLGGVDPPVERRPQRWVVADPAVGSELYAANCASCHGGRGEGKEGPALNNPVFLETVTDTYLMTTIHDGRVGTSMPAYGEPSPVRRLLARYEIESVVAHIRSWEDRR